MHACVQKRGQFGKKGSKPDVSSEPDTLRSPRATGPGPNLSLGCPGPEQNKGGNARDPGKHQEDRLISSGGDFRQIDTILAGPVHATLPGPRQMDDPVHSHLPICYHLL